jgi:organic radical activating enzyme
LSPNVTALRVSEIFQSVQGEGASAGEPALFVRLATCNLTCVWCDTKYTWDWSAYRYADEVSLCSVDEVAEQIVSRAPPRLIITGGEPLLQQAGLADLVLRLPRELVIEVETNGTLAPTAELAARIDQWNVSPKLASAQIPEQRRLRPEALLALAATGRAWLKLVIDSEADALEADDWIERLEWPRDRVLFMPQARTRDELSRRAPAVRVACESRGVRFSPRLHVERWDGRRGV